MTEQKSKAEKVYKPRKKLLIDNFLGGIVWGLGTVIGATIIVTLLSIIITTLGDVPLLGDVIDVVTQEIEQAQEENNLLEIPTE